MRDLKTILSNHAAWLADGMPAGDGRRADLYGAYLRDADLTGANLSDANLHEADLTGADLHDANLTGAYLRDADLHDANLTGAYLRDADLHDANLTGAIGITSRGPVGHEERTIYAVDHGDRVMVQAGCRWQTADEVVTAIERDYADSDLREPYIAAVREMVAEIEAQRAVEVSDD
jgi:uncharacterized protein YjbI with pentapeptide repeats